MMIDEGVCKGVGVYERGGGGDGECKIKERVESHVEEVTP
jgi:hypothetical protein